MRFMGVQYQKEKKKVSLRDRILHLLYSSILIAYCKLKNYKEHPTPQKSQMHAFEKKVMNAYSE